MSGRSLRSLDFPCSSSFVWCLSGASPEYHRRVPGVSVWPEYPVPVTGVSVLSKRHRQVSARARSLRHAPESPVPQTGVSGPPLCVHRVVPPWCLSGVPPEGARSLRAAGVSGPCYRSLRSVEAHRQDSARARSLRPAPESPVPLAGVSGPPRSVHRVVPPWCQSGGSPEGVQSLRSYPGVSGHSGRSLRPKWFPTVRNRGGV